VRVGDTHAVFHLDVVVPPGGCVEMRADLTS